MTLVKVKHAEIFPLLLIHAQDTKHGGPARLHVLASALDHNENCNHEEGICKGGSGKIETAVLFEAARALGVKRSTFYDWLADARKFGILNGTGKHLYLASQEKLSQIYLCNSIDKSKAIIPLKLLFKPGWKSLIFAAYLKANHHKNIGYTGKMKRVYKGKLVSAKTLEDLTGIPSRTQRRYKEYISSRVNIGVTKIRGDRETAAALEKQAADHDQDRHYFPFNDTRQKDPAGIRDYRRVIAHTMPARRTVSDKHARIGAHGRRAQIERAILKGLRLVNVCNYPNIISRTPAQATAKAANREARRFARRYHDNKYFSRSMQYREWTPEEIREVYIERARRGRVGVWDYEYFF